MMEMTMCDLASKKRRIDSILASAMNDGGAGGCVDQDELAGYGIAALRIHYADACPDECIRKRCDEYAAFVAKSRRSKRGDAGNGAQRRHAG
jgi:Glu-tRNA(Gln) amidotransferase subunit E-like FAD-binding protein